MPAVDLKQSVRCMDLSGESWLMPTGSDLHRRLLLDAAQGNGVAVLPIEAIRAERLCEQAPDVGARLKKYQYIFFGTNIIEARKLWLYGRYARLFERITDADVSA